ncbi:MAG: hypothetical protein CL853_03070 [Crocinitomicaceae bacterium]|nr:hypothetical protein [Crocinitomicaceae bacterium]|tara:strand:- start:2647 stop:3699 length:1053 start_codon:yes stop_codon:yes gene_type:complete
MSKRLIAIVSIFFSCYSVASQNPTKYSIESSFSYGRLLAHRPIMKKLVANNSYSFEATINFNTNGKKLNHRYYNYPIYGLTLNYTNPGNKIQIGNIVSTYGFFSLPLYNKKNALRFKLGLGVGWVEKTFDLQRNFQNTAIGSHINTNIQLKFEKVIPINKLNQLKWAILLNHLSNGSFQTPNLGLNIVQIQAAYLFGIKQQQIDTSKLEIKELKSSELSIYNSSAVKENQTPLSNKYYINETTLQYNFRKGPKTSYISGADIIVNNSLLEFTGNKIQLGVFIGHLMHLNNLKIGIQLGAYLYNRKDESETIYNKLFCEYDFSNRIYSRLSLKSHWAKADFFSLGIGYRIL